PLLEGLSTIDRVRIVGPTDLVDRTPTVAFTIDGCSPAAVSRELARDHIAVWAGDSYAREASEHLGVASTGGVVRAGIVRHVSDSDVDPLRGAAARIARVHRI